MSERAPVIAPPVPGQLPGDPPPLRDRVGSSEGDVLRAEPAHVTSLQGGLLIQRRGAVRVPEGRGKADGVPRLDQGGPPRLDLALLTIDQADPHLLGGPDQNAGQQGGRSQPGGQLHGAVSGFGKLHLDRRDDLRDQAHTEVDGGRRVR